MARWASGQASSLFLFQESSLGHQPCAVEKGKLRQVHWGCMVLCSPSSWGTLWLLRREQPPMGVAGNNGLPMRLDQGWEGRKGAAVGPATQGPGRVPPRAESFLCARCWAVHHLLPAASWDEETEAYTRAPRDLPEAPPLGPGCSEPWVHSPHFTT